MHYLITTNIGWFLFLVNVIVLVAPASAGYYVDLSSDGPIVKGGQITFTAILYDNNEVASGSFGYSWRDNAIPEHTQSIDSKSAINTWTVAYNESIYPQGPYLVQVVVCKNYMFICVNVASNRMQFNITETLNGNIQLEQKNITRMNSFVSSADPVTHTIALKQSDTNFIRNATTVLTYWFVDCTYYGFGKELDFKFNYTHPDESHYVEALVVADFTPIPIPPPTTTTTTTTTTTAKPTTSTTTTTTKKPTTTSTSKPPTTTTTTKQTTTPTIKGTTTSKKSVVKRSVETKPNNSTANATQIMVNVNGTLVPYNGSFPYVCNNTVVATDPKKTYGYFYRKIQVKEPVSKVNISGNNWLQHGDLLTLNVKCQASKTLKYCVKFERGVYNITGNESCSTYHDVDTCEFIIQRYFTESMEHTIVIIIENEVSKKVTPVTVTVYKAKKQAQLSVIVVPVVFSIAAIVAVIFGVAYYIQNRSRFVVEVADFNFGQNYSDMEYKTFRERLRDSIANAFFTRAPSPGSSEVPVWPPGRKYGSMTS